MSYPVQPQPVAAAPPTSAAAGRPRRVTAAAVLLWAMAAVGLIYAIGTLAVVPGTLERFRNAATDDADPFATVVWLGAGVSLLLAVIVVALYLVLGLALRRGSNAARI